MLFHGGLTIENVEEVSSLILETLAGKFYTFASHNSGFRPDSDLFLEVKTNQSLENGTNGSPLSFWYGDDGDYAGFSFCDTYGVWGCSTSKHDKDLRYGWDSSFKAPYVVVQHNRVKIVQLNGNGDVVCWTLAVQD